MLFNRYSKTDILWLMPSVFLFAALITYYTSAPLGDFANNYFGSYFYTQGVDLKEVYDIFLFNMGVRNQQITNVYLNYNVLPPSNLLFFIPTTIFSPKTSKLVFNIFSALLFLHSIYLLIVSERLKKITLLLACGFIAAIASNIFQGQVYLVLSALIVYGYVLIKKGSVNRGLVLWSIAAVLKIFPIILVFYFIQQAQWRRVLQFVSIILVITLIAFIAVPSDIWQLYLFDILPRVMLNQLNDPFAQSYQSMSVLLRKMFILDTVLNPDVLWNMPDLFYALDIVFKLIIALGVWSLSKQVNDTLFTLSIWLWFAIAISGYSTVYALILLFPMAVWLSSDLKRHWFALILLLTAVNLPVYFFDELQVGFQFPRLWLFLMLFTTLVYSYGVRLNILAIAGILIIGVLRFSSYSSPAEGVLVETDTKRRLIKSLGIHEDGFILKTFDADGAGNMYFELDAPILSYDTMKVKVVDNRLWLSQKLLLESNGLIKTPILVNQTDVYFLSDYGRGVGFYALRKIAVDE